MQGKQVCLVTIMLMVEDYETIEDVQRTLSDRILKDAASIAVSKLPFIRITTSQIKTS